MDLAELLQELSSNLVLLSDPDQEFVIGSVATVQEGGVLTNENVARLQQIANKVAVTQFGGPGSAKPISLRQVLSELSSVANQLSEADVRFLKTCAPHINNLNPDAIQRMLAIHQAKFG